MYFKILFVFGVLAVESSLCDERKAVPFVPAAKENILKYVKECMVEYDNDPNVINFIRDGSYGVDDKFKKFIYCAYNRAGYANNDGTILVDKVISAFPADANIGDVTKKCSQLKGVDDVDTTYQFFKCFETDAPIRIALS